MTFKNKRASLLCYFKLCASFHSHLWIQIKVTARKHPIWVKIGDFVCPAWPWNLTDDLEKTRGHLFYATLSFVDHFKAISELQSGNAQIWAKFVLTCLTYSVYLSPWLLHGPFVSRLSIVITHEQMDGRTDEVFLELLAKNPHFESDFSLILYNTLNVGVYVDSCSVANRKQVFPCGIADSIHWCTKVPNVSVRYCKTSTLLRKKHIRSILKEITRSEDKKRKLQGKIK